ncbi:MAG: NAD-dependent epimerase/dehydratase family protein [Planctomycetes bacterium]|nr:NAD-dependent epimerase/dehydratase family protein [Planctomycetota bacterium]
MARHLVTGGAGFIGSHVSEALLARGDQVRVFDSFDPYYDPAIKRATAAELSAQGVEVVEGDLRDADAVARAVEGIDGVVHLAARPGVRASIEDPHTTFAINVTGTLNLLEALRAAGVQRLAFASSSSVYGGDATAPFREAQPASRPLSPYAASKRANELMAATYVELFGLGAIGLRFFTVYGPRGRPDMAIGKFLRRAYLGEAIPLFGDGSVIRDFTYVDDIVRGVVAALDRATPGEFHVSNIGGGATTSMRELLGLIEEVSGVTLEIEQLPAAAGDMPLTHADLTRAEALLGFESRVPLREGLERTAAWTRRALGLG